MPLSRSIHTKCAELDNLWMCLGNHGKSRIFSRWGPWRVDSEQQWRDFQSGATLVCLISLRDVDEQQLTLP